MLVWKKAARPGYQMIYSVGWGLTERERTALRLMPEQAWLTAIGSRCEVRERRADDACGNLDCGHRRCWVEEAHVTRLTSLLREGSGGDQLKVSPATQFDTEGLTDRQTLQRVLSEPGNRYLAWQMCWVMAIHGMETYIVLPRDPADISLLVGYAAGRSHAIGFGRRDRH